MNSSSPLRITTFKGKNGQWYWKVGPLKGGRKIGDGSEGYMRRSSARNAAWRLVDGIRAHKVMVDDVQG